MNLLLNNFKNFVFDSNLILQILYIFTLYFFSVLLSFVIREKTKFFIYKTLTSDYILSEKRNYSSSFFISIPGIILFMLIGVGYSKTYPFNYRKLYPSKKALILFLPLALNLIFSIISFILIKIGGELFKIKLIRDFLVFSIYSNFILFLVNFLPFPFSDTFLLLTKFDISIYAFEFIQVFFIIIFSLFKLNIKLFDLFINFISKIFQNL
jgi:hypothetical protein